MSKSVTDAAGGAASKTDGNAKETEKPTEALQQASAGSLQQTGDGDVSGPLTLALSSNLQDKLMQELQESLHQVAEGFGNLTAPGDIFAMAEPFMVIDAITIPDYEDRRSGEIKVKHIFKLQFDDGRVLLTMQSDARPRRALATVFQKARALGAKATAGPYLYEKKNIVGQMQPAFIFSPQRGFEAKAFM